MDKYEYREKTEQMMKYVQTRSYDKAKDRRYDRLEASKKCVNALYCK